MRCADRYERHDWRSRHSEARKQLQQVLFASEVSSAFADRGEYGGARGAAMATSHASSGRHTDGRASEEAPKYLPASGDKAPGWGATWETGWCAVRDAVGKRWLAGGFAWSGFDYRGEPFGWDPTGGPSTTVAAGARSFHRLPSPSIAFHRLLSLSLSPLTQSRT